VDGIDFGVGADAVRKTIFFERIAPAGQHGPAGHSSCNEQETDMTDEDRKAIADFFERMKKLEAERDPEAERQIDQLMQQNPQTKYYITQMAFFLEHAQAESQNKIRELEWKLQNQQAVAQKPAGGGGFLSNIFGGGASGGAGRNVMPPPAPVHVPGYRPGMFQGGQGGGFMAGAMQTAMGIAGGMILGNMLMSMFDPGVAEAAPADEAPAEEAPAEEPGYEEEVPQVDDMGGGFDEEW